MRQAKGISNHYNLVLDEAHSEAFTPFNFSEAEIREVFDTLDVYNKKYLTNSEVSMFLEIMGEEAKPEEINEMIRMCDAEGNGRVYFSEFLKMAQGKSLAPIGMALPPMLNMLEKKNLDPNYIQVKKKGAEKKGGNEDFAKSSQSQAYQSTNGGKKQGPAIEENNSD